MHFSIFTFFDKFPQENRQLKLIITKEDAYIGKLKKTFIGEKPSIMVCNEKPFMFSNVKVSCNFL